MNKSYLDWHLEKIFPGTVNRESEALVGRVVKGFEFGNLVTRYLRDKTDRIVHVGEWGSRGWDWEVLRMNLKGFVYRDEKCQMKWVGKTLGRKIKNFVWDIMKLGCFCDIKWASQVAPVVKNPPANAGDIRDTGSIPELGRSPGGGHGNPLQYSCLENPMDRGTQRALVHRVTKSWTQLKWLRTHSCIWHQIEISCR